MGPLSAKKEINKSDSSKRQAPRPRSPPLTNSKTTISKISAETPYLLQTKTSNKAKRRSYRLLRETSTGISSQGMDPLISSWIGAGIRTPLS
jgi:hypothetical protein